MKAIIMAAGVGSRMRPLTDTIPKCLIDIAGKAVIEHQISAFTKCGIKDIVVVVGYLAEKIRSRLGGGVTYVLNWDYLSTNSIVSLFLAKEHLDSDCLIINSDVICEPSVIRSMRNCNSDICVALNTDWKLEKGYKTSVRNGCITDMSMDLTPETIFGEYAGIIMIRKAASAKVLQKLEEFIDQKRTGEWFENVFAALAREGEKIGFTDVKGKSWFEVDNIDELEEARNNFRPF
ncbi:MAG: phosphocholine cytidylyltransferase family protein [Pirellulales bacterium]|nr:phosphocholine cytidylyltransferase family protein [Pirellulales bacterium]